MNYAGTIVFSLFILIITATAYAEEEPVKKWSNETELSFVDTDGNTELMTLSAKNLLSYNITDKFSSAWKLNILYSEDSGEKTSENYNTELKFSYLFTDRLFVLYTIGGSRDTFSGIRYRINTGPGMGYKFINGPKHFLLSELGGEYVKEENTERIEDEYARGRALAKYEYEFTKKNKFLQSVEYLQSFEESEDYNIISITAITSAINSILSMKAGYEIRYDNQPAVENNEVLEKTDRILTIALVINF